MFLFLCGFTQTAARVTDSVWISHKRTVRMQILCSDSLAGRGYTYQGHLKAAHFIAKEFEQAGVQKLPGKSWFYEFSFPVNLVESAQVSIGNTRLQVGKDYIVHPASMSARGNLYRIDSLNYGLPEEWKQKDLKGKWVVIRDGLPDSLQKVETAKEWGYIETKQERGVEAGIAGLIILKSKLTASFEERPGLMPMIEILSSTWNNLPQKTTLSIDLVVKPREIFTQNVVGYVPGKEVPDSFIVLCAHYDHLGRVSEAIFYGANDNASGTSFLLSLADALAKKPAKYSVLLIAFSGEEAGLRGSIAFTYGSWVPLRKIKAVYNFDLLGNGQSGIMAVGGETYPNLYQPAKQACQANGISLAARPNAPNSDHYPFTLYNIPALFFYTMGGPPHYHDIYDRPEGLEFPVFYRFQQVILQLLNQNH
ncbi:MAG: M28 family peptidase [Bacteroidia bacterium]|nr:M28 family peptidase [Bacteroidia bacterium]